MHRTVFPHDFLADFGFLPLRAQGRVELARLELGGLQPVAEGTRTKVLRVVREAFFPGAGAGSAAALSAPEQELARMRAHACRLTPDRALDTLADAAAFVEERGMITLTADCALPSLFGAVHEEPYAPGTPGFGSWPRTRWWWSSALVSEPGVLLTKVHRGRSLYAAARVQAALDPLCRAELARAEDGAFGADAARLLERLAESGPSLGEDLCFELGLTAAEFRRLRARLERVGAVAGRWLRLELEDGRTVEASELVRWDALPPAPPAPGGLAELLVLGVAAAVVAREREARRWLTWQAPAEVVEALVVRGAAGTARARAPLDSRSRSPASCR